MEINNFRGTTQLEIFSSIHDSKCELSRVLFKTPEKQGAKILASEKTCSNDIHFNGVTMECFVWEEALEHSHVLLDSENNNGNNIVCTEIASSLPELCSSEASTGNNSIHGTNDSGSLKCDIVIPTLIKMKASTEELDDAYLKHEDLLTERMHY